MRRQRVDLPAILRTSSKAPTEYKTKIGHNISCFIYMSHSEMRRSWAEIKHSNFCNGYLQSCTAALRVPWRCSLIGNTVKSKSANVVFLYSCSYIIFIKVEILLIHDRVYDLLSEQHSKSKNIFYLLSYLSKKINMNILKAGTRIYF